MQRTINKHGEASRGLRIFNKRAISNLPISAGLIIYHYIIITIHQNRAKVWKIER